MLLTRIEGGQDPILLEKEGQFIAVRRTFYLSNEYMQFMSRKWCFVS